MCKLKIFETLCLCNLAMDVTFRKVSKYYVVKYCVTFRKVSKYYVVKYCVTFRKVSKYYVS